MTRTFQIGSTWWAAASVAVMAVIAACGGASETAQPAARLGPVAPAPAAPPEVLAAPRAVYAPALVPAPLPGDLTRTTVHRLSNGMTVYLSPDPQAPSVAAHIAVRAGARADPPQSTGLAHYLEHMMLFKGTSRLGTLDHAKERPHLERIAALYAELRQSGADRERLYAEIDAETQRAAAYAIPSESLQLYAQLGVTNQDAYTGYDATVYHLELPRNRLAQWARVEGQRFRDPVFRLFWPELEAVYEEKNQGMDQPDRRVHEAYMRAMFPSWTPVLGEVEHLKTPAYQDMVAFFERYYTPGNMAVVLAGDVDASVLPILERELGALRRPAGPAAPAPAPPALAGRTETTVQMPEDGVVLGWPMVPAAHPDRLALEVMDLLLADGSSGLIARDLLIPQKVASAGSTLWFMREGSYFELRADALDGQPHAAVEELLRGLVAKLQRGDFTDADLAAAVLSAEIGAQQESESNAARAGLLVDAFVTGVEWRDAVERIHRMKQLSRADITRVAQQYLGPRFLVVKKVKGQPVAPKLPKPRITPVAVDPSRQSALAREVLAMPAAPLEPLALVEGRDYHRGALPGGEAITVPNPRNELFAVSFAYEHGRADDRLVCAALDALKVAGAGQLSAVQVARRLHELGLSLETACDHERARIALSGIDRNLPAGMALLRELLAAPVIDPAAVTARTAAVLTERAADLATPDTIARALRRLAWYGDGSEYLLVPTNAELRAVTPAQLAASLRRLARLRHRTSYFGPRSHGDALAAIALGRGETPARPPRLERFRPGPSAVYATPLETAQANLWLAWPLAPVTPADEGRAACALGSEYIGGAGRLMFEEVRSARGLAYSVWAFCLAGRARGDDVGLYVYAGVQPDKAHDALEAILAALRKPIDEPRLALVRGAIEQQHRAERIPPREIASTVFTWQDQGARADPRAERVRRALALDRAAFERWLGAVVAGRRIAAVSGDRAQLDGPRLGAIGAVRWLPKERLFGY